MRTFLVLLRLAFWSAPLQRALTCIGAAIVVAGSIRALPFGMPGSSLPAPFLGVLFVTVACMLIGGVYWRIASAPRIVRLAPYGRRRLLVSVMVLLLLVSLLWMTQYWLFFLRWVDPRFYPSMQSQLAGLAGSLLLTTVFAVGLFIASRSPFCAMLALLAVLVPHASLTLFDVDLHGQDLATSSVALALIWIPFAIWYLKVRRISPPHWLAGGSNDVLATVTTGFTRPRSRREAQERLLLGGTTVIRFGLQWFVLLGMLLGLLYGLQQLLIWIGQAADSDAMAWAMYVSLAIYPVVTTIVSFAAQRRARTLWLLAGSSRAEFLGCAEIVLRRMHVAMALAFALWLLVLWLVLPRQLSNDSDKVAVVIFQVQQLLVLGWFTVYSQLARLPRWTIATSSAALLVLIWWLTARSGTGHFIAGMLVFFVMLTASILFRALAGYRWRDGDIPRLPTSVASGT